MAPPFPMRDVPWPWDMHWRLSQLVQQSVVVLQKLRGPRAESLVRTLKAGGATTVYVHCDYEPDNPLPYLCDVIVCASQYLVDFYRRNGADRVYCIPDPAEFWCERHDITARPLLPGKVHLCWYGHMAVSYTHLTLPTTPYV